MSPDTPGHSVFRRRRHDPQLRRRPVRRRGHASTTRRHRRWARFRLVPRRGLVARYAVAECSRRPMRPASPPGPPRSMAISGSVCTGASTCDFTFVKPCPDISAAPLTVDTATLRDGPHTIVVHAADAANNVATTAPRTVLTDNSAPGAPKLSVTGAAASAAKTIHGTVPAGPGESGDAGDVCGLQLGRGPGARASTPSPSPATRSRSRSPSRAARARSRPGSPTRPETRRRPTPRQSRRHAHRTPRSRSRTRISFSGTVTMTVSAKAPGRSSLTVSLTDARGHRVRRILRTIHLHHGRGTITFRAPRRAHHLSAHATYAGSASWLPGTAKRSVVI